MLAHCGPLIHGSNFLIQGFNLRKLQSPHITELPMAIVISFGGNANFTTRLDLRCRRHGRPDDVFGALGDRPRQVFRPLWRLAASPHVQYSCKRRQMLNEFLCYRQSNCEIKTWLPERAEQLDLGAAVHHYF